MPLRDRATPKPRTTQTLSSLEQEVASLRAQIAERFELLQVSQQQADIKTARQAPEYDREFEMLTLPFRAWDPGAIISAKSLADDGDLERAADLWESCLSDERIAAAMEQRINGLEGLPVRFTGDGEDVLTSISSDFWQMMTPGDRASMRRWGLGVGICPVYVREWIENADGRQVPVCEVWNPRFLRWRQGETFGKREWWIQTARGQIRLADQPGRWFLFAPFSGAHQRPWVDGLWYSTATWWLAKSFGIADLASFSQSHATPKWFLMPKEGAQIAPADKSEAIRRLATLPQRSGMYVPAGFLIEQKEASSNAWNAITSLLELANKALTVRILGTDSTTDKESSYASTAGGMQLLYSKFRTDADAESAFWHDGPLQFWYLLNFRGTRKLQDRRVLDLQEDPVTGSYRLLDESERRLPRKSEYGQRLRQLSEQIRAGDSVPWPTRDATPPQDMAAVADTQGKAAGALVQLTAAAAADPGLGAAIARIDFPRYLERYFPMLAQDESGAQLEERRRLLADERTDFPKQGDDKAVSLRNSGYSIFDPAYAEDIRENWPEIWSAGGNDVEGTEHSGNDQYRRLQPIVERGGKPETDTEEQAIRRREAWAARHFANNRLAGIVALMKWFVVGEIGERGMKAVIEERKDALKKRENEGDGIDLFLSDDQIALIESMKNEGLLLLAKMAKTKTGWATINGARINIGKDGGPVDWAALRASKEGSKSESSKSKADAEKAYVDASNLWRQAVNKRNEAEKEDIGGVTSGVKHSEKWHKWDKISSERFAEMERLREEAKIPSDLYQTSAKWASMRAEALNSDLGEKPTKAIIKKHAKRAESLAKAINEIGVGQSGGKSKREIETDFGVTSLIRKTYPDMFELEQYNGPTLLLSSVPRNVRQHLHEGLEFADDTVEAMAQASPDVMDDITGQILRVLADSKDYPDARKRLQDAFPSMDRSRLRNMLTGGMLIAQAAGMETVKRETVKEGKMLRLSGPKSIIPLEYDANQLLDAAERWANPADIDE